MRPRWGSFSWLVRSLVAMAPPYTTAHHTHTTLHTHTAFYFSPASFVRHLLAAAVRSHPPWKIATPSNFPLFPSSFLFTYFFPLLLSYPIVPNFPKKPLFAFCIFQFVGILFFLLSLAFLLYIYNGLVNHSVRISNGCCRWCPLRPDVTVFDTCAAGFQPEKKKNIYSIYIYILVYRFPLFNLERRPGMPSLFSWWCPIHPKIRIKTRVRGKRDGKLSPALRRYLLSCFPPSFPFLFLFFF